MCRNILIATCVFKLPFLLSEHLSPRTALPDSITSTAGTPPPVVVFAENSASLDILRVADIQSPSRFQSLSLTAVFSAGISEKEPAELERVLAF